MLSLSRTFDHRHLPHQLDVLAFGLGETRIGGNDHAAASTSGI
jgi:hypothetical protein